MYLPPEKTGRVNLETLAQAITPDTCLISVALVNNEIGIVQDIPSISQMCKGKYLHVDAAQALGLIQIDVNKLNVDMLSLSGHKIYGPKGIGALYIRAKPRVILHRWISGGGQERGYRSGTLPVPLCVGMGVPASRA